MPAFEYIGRNRTGDRVNGVIEADSSDLVADQLMHSGVTPLKIDQRVEAATDVRHGLKAYFQPKVKLEEIVMLSRQLRTLLKAVIRSGCPIP